MENRKLAPGRVARGAFYLYVSTLIVSFLGYVFWLVISKLTTPDVVGLASTAVSLAIILSSLTIFGIPTGIQRFLGKAHAEGDMTSLKSYLSNGLTVLTLASGTLVCVNYFLSWVADWIYGSTYGVISYSWTAHLCG